MAALAPCLQLVAPVGMDQETQATWFDAAMLALEGYPADLVRAGAKQAMLTADHPSKIVPAIRAYVQPILDDQRRREASIAKVFEGANVLPAPGQHQCSGDDAAAICRAHGVGRFASHSAVTMDRREQPPSVDKGRQCRKPTRADYIRLGVDPAVLDAIEADDALA